MLLETLTEIPTSDSTHIRCRDVSGTLLSINPHGSYRTLCGILKVRSYDITLIADDDPRKQVFLRDVKAEEIHVLPI